MLIEDGRVELGEWLPDLPFYGNPGLVEAKNCIPVDGTYKDFLVALGSGDALSDTVKGAYATIDNAGDPEIYAGIDDALAEYTAGTWTDRTPAGPYTLGAADYWRFAQFDAFVIATNFADVPQVKTIGAAADFADLATSGTAPGARQIGIINRFCVLGDLDDGTLYPYAIQWSKINDVRTWPTPGSAAARAAQSGRQYFNSGYGAVTGIAGGQFWGQVFQKRAITRLTYVGGDKVFQFEEFETQRGCWAPQSLIQIGGFCYFLAHDGFYRSNGQSIEPIGDGKVDKWFYSRLDQTRLKDITAGVDWINKCIYWNFPSSTSGTTVCDHVIVYNWARNVWSWAETSTQIIVQSYTSSMTLEGLDALYTSVDDIPISLDSPVWQGGTPILQVFTGNKLGTFSGDALPAMFETGETDNNPFGYTFIRGVRPMVTGDPTSISVQLATRSSQDNEGRVFGTAVTRTTRTGVCDFRTNGKYISMRMNVAGGFDRALGAGIDAEMGELV